MTTEVSPADSSLPDESLIPPSTLPSRVHRTLHRHPVLSPGLVLVVAVAVFTIANPRFIALENISLLLQQTAFIAVLAAGQTLIILTAGVDLAIGAVAVLSTLVMTKLVAENHWPFPFAVAAGVVLAMGASSLNGILVTRIRLPPFIVTLGTLSIYTAISLLYAQGQTVLVNPTSGLLWTGSGFSIGSFGLTNGVVLMVVVYVVLAVILRTTAWGRHVYASGNDARAASLAGVRTSRAILSAYVVAGVTTAIAAWILIGRIGGADPNSGVDANLQSITAVVIGGTSLFGGRGALVGSLVGALIVQVFDDGLALAGFDPQYEVLATGVLVILAVAVDQWIRKVRT